MLWTGIFSVCAIGEQQCLCNGAKLNFTLGPRGLVKDFFHLVCTLLWVFRMAKAALLCLAPQVERSEWTVIALKLGLLRGVEALPPTPLQLLLVQRNQRGHPAGPSLLFLSYLGRGSPVPAFCSCLPWRAWCKCRRAVGLWEGKWYLGNYQAPGFNSLASAVPKHGLLQHAELAPASQVSYNWAEPSGMCKAAHFLPASIGSQLCRQEITREQRSKKRRWEQVPELCKAKLWEWLTSLPTFPKAQQHSQSWNRGCIYQIPVCNSNAVVLD